ncbi:MAG: hypothetical protein K9M45_05305 [Kiritimatiellales bacterium]|nr:hypothetical protein [Kiritimatiellales bacterium]
MKKRLTILAATLLATAAHAELRRPTTQDAATVPYTGDGSDLQRFLDEAPENAMIVCDASIVLTFRAPIIIRKVLTIRGLHARLPDKLGRTALIEVMAEGVTLLDLELHGNYDSVSQEDRNTLIWISRGNFRIERCRFFDGSKDGVMITPEKGAGDLVGGVVRDIEAHRMGRDAVSIGGGNAGARIRDVTVENVILKRGYHRGAVEVSDGTDNITVRNVRAEECAYAVDVQDHGKGSAPNTNVLIEDVVAVRCKHIVRTANRDLGHANLTLRRLTGENCEASIKISNTKGVILEDLTIIGHQSKKVPPISLRNCSNVRLKNITVGSTILSDHPVQSTKCSDVKIEGLKRRAP